jgi:hypothetical protein
VIVGTATIAGMNLLSVATISVGSLNILNVITRISASGASITGEFPSSILTTTKYAPQGFLLNGKIVPSVASNNLTVAIKGMDGNDPSASNPVYVRIGDTVRTITAALSVTKNAGTNYFNSGGAELATKEIDYFVYLGYNATDGVVVGFARIPYAQQYDDFSSTSTNEKYCAISTITNAAAGDDYELIGRFAATLSAGAGYTWSVPTFTTINLIQRPIYETRLLTYVPTIGFVATGNPSTVSASNHKYRIRGGEVYVNAYVGYSSAGNAVTSITFTLPFANAVNRFLAGGTVYPAATRNVAYFYSDSKLYVDCSSIALTEVGAAGTYHLA